MHHVTTAHTNEPGTTAKWAFAMLVAIASLFLLLSGPQVAKAATAGPAFPRLATWWPNADAQSDAKLANTDYVALQNWDASHIPALRAANPSIIILGYSDARSINYYVADYNHRVNVELRSVSTDWMLTQVGSTLTANITGSTTVIPVADVTKFAVGEMALVDHELVHIAAIGSSSLTVTRGQVMPVASHAAGARIASVATTWAGTVTMDLSTNCPKRDVGHGLETWSEWNVRRGQTVLASAAWDGLLIDCLESNASWMVAPGKNRSIDPLRANRAVTDNYAAFNTAWNAGAVAYGNNLKVASGGKIVIGNGNMRNYNMNGNVFEEFPYVGLSPVVWDIVFAGPYSAPHASYAEWMANASGPNLTLIQTYGAQTNYQLMRYGLTSTLMNDGYFSHALSSSYHASAGIYWYDEYDNAGAGRGYLGQPTGAMVKVGNAYRRDYANGVALVNPSASTVTVNLGGTYRKINGTQDRTVNDGTTVTSVTIRAYDGIVLLKIAPVLPPADTTAPVTTSDAKATYVSSAAIRLSATDNVGVTATYFTVDGGAQTAGTTINVATAGSHTIQCWSLDAAGNAEARKSASFTITVPLPAGTLTVAGGAEQVTNADISITSAVTGAVDMRIDPGTGTFGPWAPYAATAQIALEGGFGTNMVRVEYRNAAGTIQLVGTIDLIQVVVPPVTPPVTPPDPPVDPPVVTPTETVIPTEPPVVPPVVIPTQTVTIRASVTTLSYGKTATLRLTVLPVSMMSVRIEKRTASAPQWARVATVTTSYSGAAHIYVKPLVTTEYRVVLADGTVSNVVKVAVTAHATATSSKTAIRSKNLVTISGKVTVPVLSAASLVTMAGLDAPTVVSVPVGRAMLQRKVGGHWVNVKSIAMSSTGRYHVHFRPGIRGTRVYRIRVSASAFNATSVSRTISIRVR